MTLNHLAKLAQNPQFTKYKGESPNGEIVYFMLVYMPEPYILFAWDEREMMAEIKLHDAINNNGKIHKVKNLDFVEAIKELDFQFDGEILDLTFC